MSLNYVNLTKEPTLLNILLSFKERLLYNEINCCRIAIVDEFYPDTLEVKVNISNKMVTNVDDNGSQIIKDYAPITAKVCYACNGISYPLKKGESGLLIFNDREIESWFVNGQVNQLSYDRCHAMTDAIFIVGLYPRPLVENAQFIENCLHIFYGTKGIKITDDGLEIDGDLKVNGKITTTGDVIINGISFLNHKHVCAGSGGISGVPQ